MKKLFYVLFFILLAFVTYRFIYKNVSIHSVAATSDRFDSHLNEIKKIISKSSKYNKNVAFFIDMRIPSGKNRFFVYDLKENKITDKGIVAHGSGSETGIKGKLQFSNVHNSLSTSLGKYAIGNSYNGKFGKAYKLYGLDKTNSKCIYSKYCFSSLFWCTI